MWIAATGACVLARSSTGLQLLQLDSELHLLQAVALPSLSWLEAADLQLSVGETVDGLVASLLLPRAQPRILEVSLGVSPRCTEYTPGLPTPLLVAGGTFAPAGVRLVTRAAVYRFIGESCATTDSLRPAALRFLLPAFLEHEEPSSAVLQLRLLHAAKRFQARHFRSCALLLTSLVSPPLAASLDRALQALLAEFETTPAGNSEEVAERLSVSVALATLVQKAVGVEGAFHPASAPAGRVASAHPGESSPHPHALAPPRRPRPRDVRRHAEGACVRDDTLSGEARAAAAASRAERRDDTRRSFPDDASGAGRSGAGAGRVDGRFGGGVSPAGAERLAAARRTASHRLLRPPDRVPRESRRAACAGAGLSLLCRAAPAGIRLCRVLPAGNLRNRPSFFPAGIESYRVVLGPAGIRP